MGDRKELWKIIYDNCFLVELVIEWVWNFLKNLLMIGLYFLIENNCEYFVISCKIGIVIFM